VRAAICRSSAGEAAARPATIALLRPCSLASKLPPNGFHLARPQLRNFAAAAVNARPAPAAERLWSAARQRRFGRETDD
jgi:hypothetical protein